MPEYGGYLGIVRARRLTAPIGTPVYAVIVRITQSARSKEELRAPIFWKINLEN
jgi:hypothetical protein